MSTIAPEPARTPPPPTAAPAAQQPRRLRPWLVLVGGLLVATAVASILLLPGDGERVYRGIFSSTGPTTAARFWPSVTLLPDGRVLVAGGLDVKLDPIATAELYDPRTGLFRPTGSMASSRAAHATLLADGDPS